MATILQIIKNFCYRLNIPAPTSFVGSTQPTQLQYYSLFQAVGDNLRNRPFNWPQLKRGYTFTTVTGERNIQLPGDFYRILNSDQWDTTNNWPMRGPISDYNFAIREFAVVSLQTRKAFRLIGPTQYLYSTAPYNQRSAGWFQIDPVGLNDTDELFLGYVSCNWIWPFNWIPVHTYNLQDIISGDGYIYICTTAGTSGTTRPNGDAEFTDGTVVWSVYREPFSLDPTVNTQVTDNCLCLFDDDLMINGMVWMYKRVKGMDYQQEMVDWEEMIKSSFGRFNGPIRINMADEISDYYEWPNCPIGSWDV